MSQVNLISLSDLLWVMLPVSIVLLVYLRWSMSVGNTLYGLGRMLIQLLLVGYVLHYIFAAETPLLIMVVLCLMLVAASFISLRPVATKNSRLWWQAFAAIFIGGVSTLILITQVVLALSPWFQPHYMIPLAGMIFANSMNAVSLAAERYEVEYERENDYLKARSVALQAALIPITNSLFAVGLVSLPGMMTGQILSGVSPLIAARYQIMVMGMVFGSAGISAALFLSFRKSDYS